jgi:hypothetical protein
MRCSCQAVSPAGPGDIFDPILGLVHHGLKFGPQRGRAPKTSAASL